jgi:hypothetical protein
VNEDLETEHPQAKLGEGDRRMLEHARQANPGAEVSLVDGKIVVSSKVQRRAPPRRPRKHPPAKIARRLAFAHEVERAIRSGKFRTSAAAALAFGMSSSEMTRFLDLTLLAPGIQEKILHLEDIDGVEPDVTERALRSLSGMRDWTEQGKSWDLLCRERR